MTLKSTNHEPGDPQIPRLLGEVVMPIHRVAHYNYNHS